MRDRKLRRICWANSNSSDLKSGISVFQISGYLQDARGESHAGRLGAKNNKFVDLATGAGLLSSAEAHNRAAKAAVRPGCECGAAERRRIEARAKVLIAEELTLQSLRRARQLTQGDMAKILKTVTGGAVREQADTVHKIRCSL